MRQQTLKFFRRRPSVVLALIMYARFCCHYVCIDNLAVVQICLLLDEMVSRKHAVVSYHDGAYWLKDLGGLNGSSINNVHAPAFVGVRLCNDDVLEFGATNFRVVFVKGGDFTETVFAEVVRKSPLTVPSSPTHESESLRG
jgi:hypothetical protein